MDSFILYELYFYVIVIPYANGLFYSNTAQRRTHLSDRHTPMTPVHHRHLPMTPYTLNLSFFLGLITKS